MVRLLIEWFPSRVTAELAGSPLSMNTFTGNVPLSGTMPPVQSAAVPQFPGPPVSEAPIQLTVVWARTRGAPSASNEQNNIANTLPRRPMSPVKLDAEGRGQEDTTSVNLYG
jgi:hypothetical protein